MRHRMRTVLGAGLVLLAVASSVGAAPTPVQRCAVAKLKAAASANLTKLKCHQRAAAEPRPVDPACLQKADDKLAAAFAKAEQKGGCATVGDAARIEFQIDYCVNPLVPEIAIPFGRCFDELRPCGPRCDGRGQCQSTTPFGEIECVDTATRRGGPSCFTTGCGADEVCASASPQFDVAYCYRLCPID